MPFQAKVVCQLNRKNYTGYAKKISACGWSEIF